MIQQRSWLTYWKKKKKDNYHKNHVSFDFSWTEWSSSLSSVSTVWVIIKKHFANETSHLREIGQHQNSGRLFKSVWFKCLFQWRQGICQWTDDIQMLQTESKGELMICQRTQRLFSEHINIVIPLNSGLHKNCENHCTEHRCTPTLAPPPNINMLPQQNNANCYIPWNPQSFRK